MAATERHSGRITFVIPSRDKFTYLRSALPSVLEAAASELVEEVIVVDNGSTDGAWEWVRSLTGYPKLRLLGPTEGGISATRNRGAREASSELLAFLDSDIRVPPDYALRIDEAAPPGSDVVTGCRVGLPANPHWIEETWHALHFPVASGPRAWINSGNLVIPRRVFESVGGFDESLTTGEDTELGNRLTKAGIDVFEDLTLAVEHLDNPKTLVQFLRKERWRAHGMLGTLKHGGLNLPLLATASFAASVLIGAFSVLAGIWGLWPWIPGIGVALTGVTLLPAMAVAFRVRKLRSTPRSIGIFRAWLLYALYLTARSVALVDILGSGIRLKAKTHSIA